MTMARCAVGQGGLPHARMHDSGFDGVAACGLVVDSKVLLVFPCNQTTLAQNACVVHGVTQQQLDSKAPDLCSTGEPGQAGAITAALFLQEFAKAAPAWVHIDTAGWVAGGSVWQAAWQRAGAV